MAWGGYLLSSGECDEEEEIYFLTFMMLIYVGISHIFYFSLFV